MTFFPNFVLEVWRCGPVLLMWSRSDLMTGTTITVAHFGSAALSRELLPILLFSLVQKMFSILFLLPLSFSREIIRYRPSGGPQHVLAGLYTNPPSVQLPFFYHFCLFISFSVSLPLSIPFCLYSEVKVKR